MAPELLVATSRGVVSLDGQDHSNGAGDVVDIARGSRGWWFVDRAGGLWSITDPAGPTRLAHHADHDLHCVAEFEPADSDVLVGASEATLLARAGERLVVDDSFQSAEGRALWYTPWGGPADVRSMSVGRDGLLYVNVHVGGILRRDERGWMPTIDIDADVHEVLAHPTRPEVVLAATARGLAISRDRAANWSFETDHLHADYCRAVAVQGDTVFLSASTGSRGHRAAVYRAALGNLRFERCSVGLPEWFDDNVDTKCIAATDDEVFVATGSGTIYRSSDQGSTWDVAASGLGPIAAMAAG